MSCNLRVYLLALLLAACVIDMNTLDAFAQNDSGQQEPTQRLCKNDDLAGRVFKMVDFRETPPRREALWFRQFPYHYLSFYLKNDYNTMAFNIDVKSPKRLNKYLAVAKGRKYYILDKQGVLTFVENDRIKYVYRCVVTVKPQYEYIPGDLILTGYTKKHKSELYKLYRRWY